MRTIITYIFGDTIKKYHTEGLDRKTVSVLLISTVCLMLIQYIGGTDQLIKSLHFFGFDESALSFDEWMNEMERPRLFQLIYWALARFIFYFLIPVIFVLVLFKERLSEYGLQARKIFSGYKIYFLFLLIMIPLVILVSNTEAFQAKYPFYKPYDEGLYPNFLIWHLFYLLQFFSLEFFFRGFMIHGTKHKIGFYSIFVMVIPYMMIHFQKPFLETTGAIIAGIALGALSLRSKSIWQGVFIHYSVAVAMDFAALYQTGYFDT